MTSLDTDSTDIHFRTNDGLDIYAKDWGNKNATQTILCLHGLTRNHKDFEPFASAFGQDKRIIAWDTRGRGLSQRDPNSSNYQLSTYVQDVLELINHLQLDKFAIVGTSMGGLITMQLMTLIPEKITGVVINDIGPILEPAGVSRIGEYISDINLFENFERAGQALKKVHLCAHPNFSDEDWTHFAERTFRWSNEGVIPDYDPAIADSLKSIKSDTSDQQSAWTLFDAMKNHPLCIVRGELSDLLSRETAQQMVQRHGKATFISIPSTGHAPMLNENECLKPLSEFLNDLT